MPTKPLQETWVSRSWAKINLGLQVLSRRQDGYHNISTGFCFINWSDRFEVRRTEKDRLWLTNSQIPADRQNLILRAKERLFEATGSNPQLDIGVEKFIPSGAGLGGGSSNAATILRIIRKMEALDLTENNMSALVCGLGADISFFIYGKTGIGAGDGSDISFHDIQPEAWILTVFPDIHVSTPEAYRHCKPDDNPDFPLEQILLEEPLEEWRHFLGNDLEPWAILQHPIIGHIKDQLYELGAVYSSMSGSGSSVYGLFQQEFVAVEAYNMFLDLGYPACLTPPLFLPDAGVYKSS